MNIELVGSTKPSVKKWKYFNIFRPKSNLEIDFKSIDTILENSTLKERDQTITALKRFTQNFARVCYSQYGWNELLKEEFK